MAKKLDLNKPVFELVQEYPELVDVLKDLGFSEITKPAMLNSVGRITTIQKGLHENETGAACELVDRISEQHPVLIMADRGYENYNLCLLYTSRCV